MAELVGYCHRVSMIEFGEYVDAVAVAAGDVAGGDIAIAVRGDGMSTSDLARAVDEMTITTHMNESPSFAAVVFRSRVTGWRHLVATARLEAEHRANWVLTDKWMSQIMTHEHVIREGQNNFVIHGVPIDIVGLGLVCINPQLDLPVDQLKAASTVVADAWNEARK